jgi:putative hydrolase
MIDLHTHSLFSDGVLVPFELARRAEVKGYKALAITDHVDASNMDFVVPRLVEAAKMIREHTDMVVIPGAEITHVPPALIKTMVDKARELGAKIVVVHGETPVEPVIEGTNRAAIEARVDILAHPGLITPEDVELAKKNDVALEVTARKGHSLTNGHVAALAVKYGAKIVINTDAHEPGDLISIEMAKVVLAGAGLDNEHIEAALQTSKFIVEKVRN